MDITVWKYQSNGFDEYIASWNIVARRILRLLYRIITSLLNVQD